MGLSGTICVEKRASIKKWKQDQIKRNEEWERERESLWENVLYTFAFASVEEEQSASASASQHF